MNEQLQWGDLHTVLVIARSGSLSGGSRRLGVSHATVFRRLGDIERRLGVRLFERSRSGYTPTPAGEDLAATAQRVEAEVLGAERRVVGQDLRLSGTVRVTTTDTLLAGLLSPIFATFQATHPGIILEVAISNHLFNLSKREADVAIRPTMTPPDFLVGRRIGRIAQGVYGKADSFSTAAGAPDFGAVDWVGPDESFAYRALDAWMAAHGLDERCRYRVDTLMGIFAAVRSGIGLAVLPCYLADDDPQLVLFGECIPELASDLWLLTHRDLRRVARIRVFMHFIARSVKAIGL